MSFLKDNVKKSVTHDGRPTLKHLRRQKRRNQQLQGHSSRSHVHSIHTIVMEKGRTRYLVQFLIMLINGKPVME
jgi:hypothetical protein